MKSIPLHDPRVRILGWYDPKEEKRSLWWSGSGIRVFLTCSFLEAEITWKGREHAPWIAVAVDGAPVCRFPLTAGTHRYPLLAGMDKTCPHQVSVIRDSQPVEGSDAAPIVLEDVRTDGELLTAEERPLLIEFLGDSLTVGEGCLGPQSAGEWRMAWISVSSAFPFLTAERMNAEMRIIALGGWGASRSWDNNPENRIGRIYGTLCAPIPGGDVPADFPERKADAVVINLGTNDGSAILRFDGDERIRMEEELCARAAELMGTVRERNPDAAILWAYGLCGRPMEPILKKAVETYRASGGQRADYLSLTPSASQGSRFHPGREAHRTAADEIVGKLRSMLGR